MDGEGRQAGNDYQGQTGKLFLSVVSGDRLPTAF